MAVSLPGMGLGELLLLAAFVFVAGLARGFSGFGLSAILMVGLTFRLAPSTVVPLAMLLEIAASLGQLPRVWRTLDWRLLALLLLGAALGNPMGVMLLVVLPAEVMRPALLLAILLASLLLLSGVRFAGSASLSRTLVAGLASGLANGAAALGGLPLVLFLAANASPPPLFRATLIAYLLIGDLYALALFWGRELITPEVFHLSGLALPVLALGLWLGGRRFLTTEPERFRSYTLLLLMVLTLIGLVGAIS